LSPSERSRLIDELSRAGLARGARVLVVTREPVALAGGVESAGYVPLHAEPTARLDTPPASCDAAIVVDALERTEWDRWLLQQVRRALKPDAPLLLVARNLWSLVSPWDAAGLAGRITGLVARRAVERLVPRAPDAPLPNRRFRGRKYRGRVLTAMLERLGFEVESCAGGGTSAEWRIRARARERGVLGGSVPLGPCAEHVAAYEQEYADFVAARDAWVRAHSRHAPGGVVEVLDPAAYANATAIVLAPHPDDEIIGCGGTILRLARAGCRVVCVQATDGSDGWAVRDLPEAERREVRITEARAVAQAAGIRETDFWRESNRAFRPSDLMIGRLAALFTRLEPRLVFTPFLTDAHRDHRTLNAIAAGAILAAGDALDHARVLGYEVWALAPASVVCDVTEWREAQETLLRTYEYAMKVDDFVDLCERRNYYNACRLLGRPGYAEAFHACPAADYPALVTAAYQRSPTASV
jgi:LmbE family N-acetylglucosaminyl deacetylase